MRTLAALLNECDLHLQALNEAMGRCPQPLTEAHFTKRDPDVIASLDQFAYRFILNLLERYGFLPSVSRWQEIREIRNQITHEYQLSPAELVATLRIAFGMVTEMAGVIATLSQRNAIKNTNG